MANERDAFIENGWKQFCVLRPNDHESLCAHAHIDVDEQNYLLVISQTCDLVNDVEKEPFFEVACLRQLGNEPSPANAHGKNSRRFELSLTINGASDNYFLLAHERFLIKHELLSGLKPFDVIEDSLIKDELIGWITARYSRTAFPDSFVDRLRPQISKIEKSIRKLKLIEGIYVQISSFEELKEDESYNISIILLMEADDFDDEQKYEQYEILRKEFEEKIGKCEGLELESVDLVSNAGITVKELQEFAFWDYSYLSYRDPAEHALPN